MSHATRVAFGDSHGCHQNSNFDGSHVNRDSRGCLDFDYLTKPNLIASSVLSIWIHIPYIYIYTYQYICLYICIFIYIYANVSRHVSYTCIYVYVCIYIYTYMHIYICICIYIYVYTSHQVSIVLGFRYWSGALHQNSSA